MSRVETKGTHEWALVAIGVLGIALGVLELVVGIPLAPPWAPPAPLLVVNTLVGWSFVAAAVVAMLRRPDNRVGVLLAAVGITWFVQSILTLARSSFLFTLSLLGDGLFWLPLVHLFLSFPTGRLSSRMDRAVVALLYGYLPLGNLMSVVFFDPRTVGREFPANVFLLRNDPSLAALMVTIDSVAAAMIAVLVLVRLVLRWRAATGPMRRVMRPVVWAVGPALLAVVYFIVSAVVALPDGLRRALLPLINVALAGLPVAFLVGLLRTQLGRRLVGDLVVELQTAMAHGRLREALARGLGDPTLELAFVLPGSGRYVDDQGHYVRIPDEEEAEIRRITELIDSDGEPLAVLIHDASLLQDGKRVEAVAGAARLTLENERLHAQLQAQLDEARASRARLVDAADQARRRLERDLHDGAQQRLLAASTAMERARILNGNADDSRLEDLLEAVSTELKETLTELRELARGIHPALLTDEGLGPAIESLARRAQLPTRVVSVPSERFQTTVEAAAYFVVAEALNNAAKHADASEVMVRAESDNGVLRIQIADDGIGGADIDGGSGLRGLEDRVVSLGGVFEVASPHDEGTTISAVIPLHQDGAGRRQPS